MKKTINVYEFADTFAKSDTYKDNFTRAGLFALFEYLEQYEEDIDHDTNFDMVAICCDYAEYSSAWEAMRQYQPEDMPLVEDSEGMDLVEIGKASEALALEWLQERTTVITFAGGIIIQQF